MCQANVLHKGHGTTEQQCLKNLKTHKHDDANEEQATCSYINVVLVRSTRHIRANLAYAYQLISLGEGEKGVPDWKTYKYPCVQNE